MLFTRKQVEALMMTIEEGRIGRANRPLWESLDRAQSLVTVIVPTRNEAGNLPRCLESLRGAGEVYVIESNSTDETPEIARTYSNWEARVWLKEKGNATEIRPALLGSQAQRRRWLRKNLFDVPGSPILFLLYKYFFRLGLLDGIPGLLYCGFQGIQFFHMKAKIYELAKG
jgi:hypothetical protein